MDGTQTMLNIVPNLIEKLHMCPCSICKRFSRFLEANIEVRLMGKVIEFETFGGNEADGEKRGFVIFVDGNVDYQLHTIVSYIVGSVDSNNRVDKVSFK